jgi:hypothetical protein
MNALKNVKNHVKINERPLEMKNKYPKLKKIFNKTKGYLDYAIGFLWATLFWEGHRILPGAKSLSEIIPLWAVILNLLILFVISIYLRKARDFSLVRRVGIIIAFTISAIIWSIGYKHFSTISLVGGGAIFLINWGLKKEDSKKEEKT